MKDLFKKSKEFMKKAGEDKFKSAIDVIDKEKKTDIDK